MKLFCGLFLSAVLFVPLQTFALTSFANARTLEIPHRIFRIGRTLIQLIQEGRGETLFRRIGASHWSVESGSLSRLRSYVQLFPQKGLASTDHVILTELMHLEETNLRAIRSVLITDLFRGLHESGNIRNLRMSLCNSEALILEILREGEIFSVEAIRWLRQFYALADDFAGQEKVLKQLSFDDFTVLEDLLKSPPTIRMEIERIIPHLRNGKPSRARAYAYEGLVGIRDSLMRAKIIEANGRGYRVLPARHGEISPEEVDAIGKLLRTILGRKELLHVKTSKNGARAARALKQEPLADFGQRLQVGFFDPEFAGDVSRLTDHLSHVVGQLR